MHHYRNMAGRKKTTQPTDSRRLAYLFLEVINEELPDLRLFAVKKDVFDTLRICGSTDVRAFPVERFPDGSVDRGDVVTAQEILFLSDAKTSNVNARDGAFAFVEDLAVGSGL